MTGGQLRPALLGVVAGATLSLVVVAPVWTTVADERAEDLRRSTAEQTQLVLAAVAGRGAGGDDRQTVLDLGAPGRRDVLLVTSAGTTASRPGLSPSDLPGEVVAAVEASTAPAEGPFTPVDVGSGDGFVASGGAVYPDTQVYVLLSSRPVDEANGLLLVRLGALVGVAAGVGAALAWATGRTRLRRARVESSLERERNSDMAHELRTPVATILTASTLAVEAVRHQPPEVVAPVQLVADEARRLRVLVDDSLELRRVENNDGGPGTELVDLAQLIPAVVAARTWAVPVRTDIGAGSQVAAERRDITRLVVNLLDNAARHARSQVWVRCTREGSVVRLIVTDDGPGIPAAEAERVFDRFYRAPGAPAGGTGLGLPIVRAVAKRLGGRVHVDLAHGSTGASLVVELPAGRAGAGQGIAGPEPT